MLAVKYLVVLLAELGQSLLQLVNASGRLFPLFLQKAL